MFQLNNKGRLLRGFIVSAMMASEPSAALGGTMLNELLTSEPAASAKLPEAEGAASPADRLSASGAGNPGFGGLRLHFPIGFDDFDF